MYGFFNAILTRLLKLKVIIILLIAITMFLVLFYRIIIGSFERNTEHFDNDVISIKKNIEWSFDISKSYLYTVSIPLGILGIQANNSIIHQLLDEFIFIDNKYGRFPFYDTVLFDTNNNLISSGIIPRHYLIPEDYVHNKSFYINIRNSPTPFEPSVEKIYIQDGKKYIPTCKMIGSNQTRETLGGVCSIISIKNLLSHIYDTNARWNYEIIEIFNISDIDEYLSKNELTTKKLDFKIVLKSLFFGKDLFLVQELHNFPYFISLKINIYVLYKDTFYIFLFAISHFIIFLIFIVYAFSLNSKIYKRFFHKLHEKILNSQKNLKDKELITNMTHDNIERLVTNINDIIDYSHSLHNEINKQNLSNDRTKIYNKVMHLLLIEGHYRGQQDIAKISHIEAELSRLANEELTSAKLSSFINEITDYCCNYYEELSIKIDVSKKDNKRFYFKHAALSETIFHIFSLIMRMGKFNIDDRSLLIKAYFHENNSFPTIVINAILSEEENIRVSGWEYGPDYIYSGMLSALTLAKENDLYFYVKQNEQVVSFILEPIPTHKLEKIDEILVKVK